MMRSLRSSAMHTHHEVETSLLRLQLDISPVSAEPAATGRTRLRDEAGGHPCGTPRHPRRFGPLRTAVPRRGPCRRQRIDGPPGRRTGPHRRPYGRGNTSRRSAQLPGSHRTRCRGAGCKASVAVHDGNGTRSLAGWAHTRHDVASSAATIVFAANGDLATARATPRLADAGPPTMAARCARNLAEGLLLTMDQPYPVAMANWAAFIATEQLLSWVIPDSLAALVTLCRDTRRRSGPQPAV